MTDYYRKPINKVVNDVKLKMQLGALTLKLNENNNKIDDLIGVDKNIKKDISTNKDLITANTSSVSSNKDLIDTNTSSISSISQFILKSDKDFEKTYNIESQRFEFNTNNHFFNILEKEIEHDFIKNSLLFVKNNIYYKYDDLSDDYHRCQHEYKIYDNENNLINKYLFNKDTYYDENSSILNTNEEFCIYFKNDYNKIKIVLELHRHNRHGFGKINLEIDDDYENYIKLDYIEKGFLDNSHLINLNTGSISTNKSDISDNSGLISTNTSSISSNSGLISTNTSSISSNSGLISTNTSSISSNSGKIDTNSGLISTNTSSISSNSGLISTNTSDIADNLEKINNLQNANIKAFFNLDQIFIYDIENGYKNVDKDNHFHIFEKEITYNFTKNSYLEIALKVLTEISNYIFIGFFQILCNFYDQDNNLFYTISLSTAMGSINKLSTIKSVFIVPINKNMSKIKIDFFIAPKETQQHRSARFSIQDINSNKIYIKYFQKTEEMSIKNIQDSLNKNYLKNFYNELYHENDLKVSHIFYDKIFTINAKKTDFLEVYFKIQLDYDDLSNAKYVDTNFILYDMHNGQELFSKSYDNDDYIGITNVNIILQNAFYYTFDRDVNKLKIAITFSLSRSNLNITYKSINTNRLIIKHYGN